MECNPLSSIQLSITLLYQCIDVIIQKCYETILMVRLHFK